jgi:hypothetical protein
MSGLVLFGSIYSGIWKLLCHTNRLARTEMPHRMSSSSEKSGSVASDNSLSVTTHTEMASI